MPIRAIGARAMLDFPDDIHFDTTPVKVRVDIGSALQDEKVLSKLFLIFLLYNSTIPVKQFLLEILERKKPISN